MNNQATFPAMEAAAEKAGPMAAERVHGLQFKVGHGSFNLVIMNPPFTRQGGPKDSQIPNPAFAAFDADPSEQRALKRHLQGLAAGGHANSKAGLASHFVELAHRKLEPGGKMALVLPLSALSGVSWEKVRKLWRTEYTNITVVTIAGAGTHARSFSADTGMAECMVVADQHPPDPPDKTATHFVMLARQSPDPLVGAQLATAITDAINGGDVGSLEGGPHGGVPLRIGDEDYGHVVRVQHLPASVPWQLAGIKDPTLAQIAYQLTISHLWIDGADRLSLPVVPIREVIHRMGFNDPSIIGRIKTGRIPQGPFDKLPGCPPGTTYPSLWSHNAKRERRLVVEPDSHCRTRTVDGKVPPVIAERAAKVWATAGRIHFSRHFRYNSQSLAVAFTELPTIGGTTLPTVLFHDPRHEYAFALWCNSTLGLMLHWWSANKSQSGRGHTTVSGIPDFPTLDLRTLNDHQLAECEAAFNDLRDHRFLPFNQLHEDPARAELDRRLLAIVLGPPALTLEEPLQRLRLKLAHEPQIDGGKKSKVVFTAHGETTERVPERS